MRDADTDIVATADIVVTQHTQCHLFRGVTMSDLSAWLAVHRTRKLAGLCALTAGAVFLWLRWLKRGNRPLVSGLLTPSQFETLQAVADTLIPCDDDAAAAYPDDPIMRAFFLRKASDVKTAEAMLHAVVTFGTPESVQGLSLLLTLLDTTVGTFVLTGHWGRFAGLPVAARERILARWSTSWLNTVQKAEGPPRARPFVFLPSLSACVLCSLRLVAQWFHWFPSHSLPPPVAARVCGVAQADRAVLLHRVARRQDKPQLVCHGLPRAAALAAAHPPQDHPTARHSPANRADVRRRCRRIRRRRYRGQFGDVKWGGEEGAIFFFFLHCSSLLYPHHPQCSVYNLNNQAASRPASWLRPASMSSC